MEPFAYPFSRHSPESRAGEIVARVVAEAETALARSFS